MKLSIITVNLNDKDGLQRTIKSIVEQTFTNYEIIIIDGESTDGSLDIIEQYKSKINYSISEKDSGIYNAMNKGIEQAKGEYCYFLNAGDIFDNKDVLAQLFGNNPHDSFICGNFTTEIKGNLKTETPYKNRDWTFSLYDIYSGDLCHQAFFIKREMFSKYEMYNEELRITSDWRLFFIAIGLHHESVLYQDINIVTYNLEGLSSTIGGQVIYDERKKTAKEVLSPQIYKRLNRLYYLEQNSYITDTIDSRKWLLYPFRLFCKIWRTLGLLK